MEKNKLYTVNKWNRPLFGNRFEIGGGFNPWSFMESAWPQINAGLNLQTAQPLSTNWVVPSIYDSNPTPFMPTLYDTNVGNVKEPNIQRMSVDNIQPLKLPKYISNNPWASLAATKGYSNVDDYTKSTNFFGLSKLNNPFSKGNIAGGIGAMAKTPLGGMGLMVGSQVVGGLARKALSDGFSTGIGDGLANYGSMVGSAIGTVNPLAGAVATLGSNVLGGAWNHTFGMKTNKDALNNYNNALASWNNYTSNANSYDQIQGPENFSFQNIYKGGWARGHDARQKNRNALANFNAAKDFAYRSMDNNIYNIGQNTIEDYMRGYGAALGGSLKACGGNLFYNGGPEYPLIKNLRKLNGLEFNNLVKKTKSEDWENLVYQARPEGTNLLGYDEDGNPIETIINGYAPVKLRTFYPLGNEYPVTGHSELEVPISDNVVKAYGLKPDYAGLGANPTVIVSKKGSDLGYNLITNNCADATSNYLNQMYGKSNDAMFFTTPGDVRDYAVDKLGGKKTYEDGIETVLIPRNARNADAISEKALLLSTLKDSNFSGAQIEGYPYWLKFPYINDVRYLNGNKYIENQHSIGGNLFPDGGVLTEVVVTPSAEDKQVRKNFWTLFPDKDMRDSAYAYYDRQRVGDRLAQNEFLNNITTLHNLSGNPTIHRGDVISFLPAQYRKSNGTPRPHYVNNIVAPNDMYNINNFNDYLDELTHAYQYHGPKRYGLDTISWPGDIEINGKSGYDREGHPENAAHKVIGDAMKRYLIDNGLTMRNGKTNRENFVDKLALGIPDNYPVGQDWLSLGGNLFNNGGGIHIDPSKKGTFTAAASKRGMGVQEFASKVLSNKEDYSSAMVKKANFAHVFGGRNYSNGGNLYPHGGYAATSFLDDFSQDPIAAVMKYNQMQADMAAQREAMEEERAKEEQMQNLQKQLMEAQTNYQGLQSLYDSQATAIKNLQDAYGNISPIIPPGANPGLLLAGVLSDALDSKGSTGTLPKNNKNWNYIKRKLKASGKFTDTQIDGIGLNLMRESGFDPEAIGDGGSAFGIAQWHGNRKPKDKTLDGQITHLINTLSEFDGKEHWIGRKNYNGFMNARTPEEAHYYIANGWERPKAVITDSLRREMNNSLINAGYAFGGELGTNGTDWYNGLLQVNEGSSHEMNPLGGVPMGVDQQGTPNLVEEGETVYAFGGALGSKPNPYVFSRRKESEGGFNVPLDVLAQIGIKPTKKQLKEGVSYAEASKVVAKESEERPMDDISQRGLEHGLGLLAQSQEQQRQEKQMMEQMAMDAQREYAALGGRLCATGGNLFTDGGPTYIADKRGDNLLGYDSDGNPIELNVVAPKRWTSALPLTWTPEYRERERKKKEKRKALGRLFDYTTQMAFPELELMQPSASFQIPRNNEEKGISKEAYDYLLKRAVLPVFEEQVGYNPEEVEESFKRDPFKATSTPVYPNDVLDYIKGFVKGDNYATGGPLGSPYVNLFATAGSLNNPNPLAKLYNRLFKDVDSSDVFDAISTLYSNGTDLAAEGLSRIGLPSWYTKYWKAQADPIKGIEDFLVDNLDSETLKSIENMGDNAIDAYFNTAGGAQMAMLINLLTAKDKRANVNNNTLVAGSGPKLKGRGATKVVTKIVSGAERAAKRFNLGKVTEKTTANASRIPSMQAPQSIVPSTIAPITGAGTPINIAGTTTSNLPLYRPAFSRVPYGGVSGTQKPVSNAGNIFGNTYAGGLEATSVKPGAGWKNRVSGGGRPAQKGKGVLDINKVKRAADLAEIAKDKKTAAGILAGIGATAGAGYGLYQLNGSSPDGQNIYRYAFPNFGGNDMATIGSVNQLTDKRSSGFLHDDLDNLTDSNALRNFNIASYIRKNARYIPNGTANVPTNTNTPTNNEPANTGTTDVVAPVTPGIANTPGQYGNLLPLSPFWTSGNPNVSLQEVNAFLADRDFRDKFAAGVNPKSAQSTSTEDNNIGVKTYDTWMRYAPVFGSGILTLTDLLGLTSKPDYTYANKLEAYANRAGYTPNIGAPHIGDYMRYIPTDRQYMTNLAMANARATDRNLMNLASGNRAQAMAGILSNGYNTTVGLGNIFRGAEDANYNRYATALGFNRGTNQFNAQQALQAALANAQYRTSGLQLGLSGLAQAAQMRAAQDAMANQARSANITNLLQSLSNIGRENFAINQLATNRALDWTTNTRGEATRKKRTGK